MNNYIPHFMQFCSTKLNTPKKELRNERSKIKERIVSRQDSQTSYEVIRMDKSIENTSNNYSLIDEFYNDDSCLIDSKTKKINTNNMNKSSKSLSVDKRKNTYDELTKRKSMLNGELKVELSEMSNSVVNFKNVIKIIFIYK
jgi:hypothetical protein